MSLTFNQLNVSLLNKSMNFFLKKMYVPQTFEWYSGVVYENISTENYIKVFL